MSEIDLSHPMNVCRASAGTGKTFTLAACYVGLLLSGESFRNILAVTFTNKATAEMKTRILTYLYAIANENHDEDAFFEKAKSFMVVHMGQSDEQLRRRAGQCFEEMLLDFDNVQVSTIDSFLQTLLAGLAKMLGKGAGYATELNLREVIAQAVDRTLSEDMTLEMERIMVDYLKDQMRNEAQWDVRRKIIDLAYTLYNESVQMLTSDEEIEYDPARILQYKKHIDNWRQRIEFHRLEKALERLEQRGEKDADMRTLIDNLRKSLYDTKSTEKKDCFRGMTDNARKKFETEKDKKRQKLGDLYDMVLQTQDLCDECRRIYRESVLTTAFLMDMRIMKGLIENINATLQENNRTLLARTANTLRNVLRPGDADFVLEKAGIRYKHIMIDEFQDTSRLQWSVFLPLLREVLASYGHSVLIVGDIKQSIYRWRNGDWHIMHALGTENDPLQAHFNSTFKPLVKNFRSRRNVVHFNLHTMQCVVENEASKDLYDEGYQDTNLTSFYNAKNDGGYVRLRIYPKVHLLSKKADDPLSRHVLNSKRVQQDILKDMFDTIETLLVAGERPADILILVRSNLQAGRIVNYFNTLRATPSTYSLLPRTQLVSGDSFCLNRSSSVMLLIYALRYIHNADPIAKKYIELSLGHTRWLTDIDTIDRQLPLYELVQTLFERLECDAEGRFIGEDIAYVNSLFDKLRDFVSDKGSDVPTFLQYWDEIMYKESIPAPDANAIHIMTIHASKGLESKTLFIPFCTWEMEPTQNKECIWCDSIPPEGGVEPLRKIPIKDEECMLGTTYEPDYQQEHNDQRIDALNMLYVALTRAADNLYIYADEYISKQNGIDENNIGTLLMDAYKLRQPVLHHFYVYSDEEQPCFAEYTLGEQPYIHRPERAQKDEPFAFNHAAMIAVPLRSDSRQVRFRQSQESALYSALSSKAEEVLESINIGTICHDILAHMEVKNDLSRVVEEFSTKGIIGSEQQKNEILSLIERAWQEPLLCDWFSGEWQLLREQAILIDGDEKRPDRVMIRGDEVIVLDYKFGVKQAQYTQQVKGYMDAMRRLGYGEVKGYLWYAKQRQLEQVQ